MPAVHPRNASICFIAFGPVVFALSVLTGAPLASFATDGIPGGGDAFVSSPVLSAVGDALYLHSASKTLWRLSVALDALGAPSFGLAWYCRYSPGNIQCIPPTEGSATEAVAGGFYQPTTRQQRDELPEERLVRGGAHLAAQAPAREAVADLTRRAWAWAAGEAEQAGQERGGKGRAGGEASE